VIHAGLRESVQLLDDGYTIVQSRIFGCHFSFSFFFARLVMSQDFRWWEVVPLICSQSRGQETNPRGTAMQISSPLMTGINHPSLKDQLVAHLLFVAVQGCPKCTH
jgi:hypothetical protein